MIPVVKMTVVVEMDETKHSEVMKRFAQVLARHHAEILDHKLIIDLPDGFNVIIEKEEL